MTYDGLEELSCYGATDPFTDDQSTGQAKSTNKELGGTPALSRNAGGSVSSALSGGASDRDVRVFVAVRPGTINWAPGYQPSVICRAGIPSLGSDPTLTSDPTLIPPSSITTIGLNSNYGMFVMGNEYGFALVNYVTCVCVLTTSTLDLFSGVTDLSIRLANRSPGRNMAGSPADSKASEKSVGSNSTTPIPTSSAFRSQTFSVDPQTQSPDTIPIYSPSTSSAGRYTVSTKAAAFRGELKRAKSQVVYPRTTSHEKWSELSGTPQGQSFSASTLSLDQLSSEGLRAVAFMDCQIRKQDETCVPSLWLGTTRGNVLTVNLKITDARDQHVVTPVGCIYRLQGEIILISFLDPTGAPLCSPSSKWEDGTFVNPKSSKGKPLDSPHSPAQTDGSGRTTGLRQGDSSVAARRLGTSVDPKKAEGAPSKVAISSSSRTSSSSTSSTGPDNAGVPAQSDVDKHLVVICSEKQACVISIPSQTCVSKVKITETSAVVRASIQRFKSSTVSDSFLTCYLANGHLVAFSLPSLRMLMDVDYVPASECVLRSFAFGQNAQAIYLTTPSELVKITWSAESCSNLRDMQGELFVPCTMPEPPRKGFFMNLIAGSTHSSVDRDELFGEAASGKSAPGTSTLLPNTRMEKVTGQTGLATSEVARARNAAIERGEKLEKLDLQAQEMSDQAKGLGRTAAMLAAKFEKKDKRWGWPL